MLNLSSVLLVQVFLVIVILKYLYDRRGTSRILPFPPGPKPLPLIGNLLDVPKTKPWVTYANWRKQYGDLIHFQLFGRHIIVVNSWDVAADLFERRSSIYSDRPVTPINELTGWDFVLGFRYYGDGWRERRRMFHQRFNSRSANAFHPIQAEHISLLLKNLSISPDKFESNIQNFAASLVLRIVYGYQMAPEGDKLVSIIDKTMRTLADLVRPSARAVNSFPILKYLPEWVPGAGFQKMARACRNMIDDMRNIPFSYVTEQMAKGSAEPSMTTDMLEKVTHVVEGDTEEVVKDVAATAFVAGADTTVSSLTSFLLAMTLYPEVQRKAQAEIDRVVGEDRLPDFGDRRALPYISAIFQELLRWSAIVPLSLPHATSGDDVYNGYYIPKGATVWGNIWAMTRDESVYPQPNEFRPERFLEGKDLEEVTKDNAAHMAFGFGRRVCVGRYMADATIWLAIASMLAVFRIDKAKDEQGRVYDVHAEFTDELVIHPLPFKCSITPRSSAARALLEQLHS